jgi:hypothetical protein
MRAQKTGKERPKKKARVSSSRLDVNEQLRLAVVLRLLGQEELIDLEEKLELCEKVEYQNNEQ